MLQALKLFHREYVGDQELLDFSIVNELTIPYGYLVAPDVCTKSVLDYVKSRRFNPNATFYKEWRDILSKTRFELLVDQIRHYLSTYGTAFTGVPYIPNDAPLQMSFLNNLTVITSISKEEIIEKCKDLIYSGVALDSLETVRPIMDIFRLFHAVDQIDIEAVKNREVKVLLYTLLNIIPDSPIDILRFLVHHCTGSSLLIKDKMTIYKIKTSDIDLSKYLTEKNCIKLSEIFYRFKPIFLAFRAVRANRKAINKIRKLARTHHKPFITPKNILRYGATKEELDKYLKSITNFKKVALIEEILYRSDTDRVNKPYPIRNGKLFIKEENNYKSPLGILQVYESLVKSLRPKACKVKLPKDIHLVAPRSEKTFIGDYPMYSYVEMTDDTIIGIYWREEWGANDFDLSFLDRTGSKIGWNSSYYNGDVVFSGDMTSADPEAAELLLFRRASNVCGLINVNLYSGDPDSKFNLFVGKEHLTNVPKGYMLDPSKIILSSENSIKKGEKVVGLVANGLFSLVNLRTGSKIVSSGKSITNCYSDYAMKTQTGHLELEGLLADAGFEIVDENPDIDLSIPDKSAIIKLLS